MVGSVISIKYHPDYETVCKSLHIEDELREEYQPVYESCVEVSNPKAAYCIQEVKQDGDNTWIGDSCFSSRIMYKNFEGIHRAFVYVATCGSELYNLGIHAKDDLDKWWIEQFSQEAMKFVLSEMMTSIQEKYDIGHMASMNPGSIPEFPLKYQKELFHLIEKETAQIGMQLTSSYLMLPHKSVSGFLYETDKNFVNCQLCPRKNCPERRARFDINKVQDYGLDLR